MAYGKRAQLERLLQAIENAENGWIHERGLAALLPHLVDDDDDDDGNYTDCEGVLGLRGLLYYVDPRTERPADYVTE
jgi:hypothetical protein